MNCPDCGRECASKRSLTWHRKKCGRVPTVEELMLLGDVAISESGCWEWGAGKFSNGYGRCKYGRAHRAMFEASTGETPGAHFVCHTCDNPGCVNPDHLWLGDPQSNMTDKVRKGRHVPGHNFGPQPHLRGEGNPMSRPEVRAKVSGDNHWRRRATQSSAKDQSI